ncbi:MAG: glucosaminidase domain-containing protein [Saprospiraceae bacterium]|nr:glucosaminidase domain-containing protein [Saprospiraceae bacterium]
MYIVANFFSSIVAYCREHWFKLSLLALILVFLYKKELSVNFKVGSKEPKKELKDNKITSTKNNPTEEVPLSIFGSEGTLRRKTEEMPQIDENAKVSYLKRFAQVAVAERKKFGIPASIVLANALRQSYAGQRNFATQSNNHFALPCTEGWIGTSDKYGETCIRHYDNAWLSFRDHSLLITSGSFANLKQFGDKDYKAWAKGLQQNGYPCSSAHLAEDLIAIIEKYRLEQLDKL